MKGAARAWGINVITQSESIKLHVGYMTQKFTFYEDLSIAENLDFVARMYSIPNRRAAVKQSLDELGLTKPQPPTCGPTFWRMEATVGAGGVHASQSKTSSARSADRRR